MNDNNCPVESKFAQKFHLFSTLHPQTAGETYMGGALQGRGGARHDMEWYLERFLADGQGDGVVIWGSLAALEEKSATVKWWRAGRRLLELENWFREHNVCLMTIYSQGHHGELFLDPAVVRELSKWGNYLGENVGELMNRWFGGKHPASRDGTLKDLREVKNCLVNDFLKPVVAKLKNMGYPRVFSTSCYACANLEFEAGFDAPFVESLCCDYNVSEMRGACRKWQRPYWGSYFNHDWYTKHIPYAADQRFALLRAALHLAWMNGAAAVCLESGNFWTEGGYHTRDSSGNVDYEHPICRRYRDSMADFYAFTRKTPRAPGGPIVPICFALGHLDGHRGQRSLMGWQDRFCRHRPAIWGQQTLAKNNFNYLYNDPEAGWDIFFKTVFPMRADSLAPYHNHRLCGAPFGAADVVCIDEYAPADALAYYKLIVYTGWNTMEPAIYQKLVQYVKGGGTLLMALPHLSTRADREFWNYTPADLINGGDLRELFGITITGKGRFILQLEDLGRWEHAAFPFYDYDVENESQLPRRLVSDLRAEVLAAEMQAGPETEPLFLADVRGQYQRPTGKGEPVFLRHKLGAGCAYLVAAWDYPGAVGLQPLYTHIVKNLLFEHRNPRAYISDPGAAQPGENCQYVFFTVYPETVYVLNTDCVKARAVDLWLDGRAMRVDLAPGEFRAISLDQGKGNP